MKHALRLIVQHIVLVSVFSALVKLDDEILDASTAGQCGARGTCCSTELQQRGASRLLTDIVCGNRWIFVHGFTHTGTSLTQSILGHEPGVEMVPFEGQWYQSSFPAWNANDNTKVQSRRNCECFPQWTHAITPLGKAQAMRSIMATDGENAMRARLVSQWLSPSRGRLSFSQLLAWPSDESKAEFQHLRVAKSAIVVEKDPRFDTIQLFQVLFPMVSLPVFLMRHPFNTHTPSELQTPAASCRSVMDCLSMWWDWWSYAFRLLPGMPQYCVVRFEDIVYDPVGFTQSVMGSLVASHGVQQANQGRQLGQHGSDINPDYLYFNQSSKKVDEAIRTRTMLLGVHEFVHQHFGYSLFEYSPESIRRPNAGSVDKRRGDCLLQRRSSFMSPPDRVKLSPLAPRVLTDKWPKLESIYNVSTLPSKGSGSTAPLMGRFCDAILNTMPSTNRTIELCIPRG